ncbi:hypothetical protein [Roseobacter sp.]|uniref:hypothetical protein n=1 Tax=Roseobacter sp. TaxID=1907202 RepID=UPI00385F1C0F
MWERFLKIIARGLHRLGKVDLFSDGVMVPRQLTDFDHKGQPGVWTMVWKAAKWLSP